MDIAKKSHEAEEVVEHKEALLHGKSSLENKAELGDNKANKVDLGEGMAEAVRKAVVLDYLEGGDGTIGKRLSAHKAANPEIVEHSEVDELYPKG